MFSVRIVTADHYQSIPVRDFDVCYSDFRGCEIYKVPVIRVFGLTPAGQKVCLHIHGVFPYMYILCDENMPKHESDHQFRKYAQELAFSIDKALNVASRSSGSFKHHVYKIVSTSGIPFYGYHDSPRSFLKIFFYDPNKIKQVADLLASGVIMNKIIQPYEAHIPYILQFFIDSNLFGMNFLNVSTLKFRVTADDYFSTEDSPTLLPPSNLNSPIHFNSSNKIWSVDEINRPPMCSKIKKLTCCELEADCTVNSILNRLDSQQSIHGNNPGILAIWEEERKRRREKLESSQITPASSQERPDVVESESELFYKERLKKLLHKTDDSRTSVETTHVTSDTTLVSGSQSPMSSQKSFNPSSSLSDTQDKELLSMFLSMVNTQEPAAEQDSVLSQVIHNEDEEEDDDAVTMEMSQCVDDDGDWILKDSLNAMDDSSGTVVDDKTRDQRQENDQVSSDSKVDDYNSSFTIPQLDGAGDDEEEDEREAQAASKFSENQSSTSSASRVNSKKRTRICLRRKKGSFCIKREGSEEEEKEEETKNVNSESMTKSVLFFDEAPSSNSWVGSLPLKGLVDAEESNSKSSSIAEDYPFMVYDHGINCRINSNVSPMSHDLHTVRTNLFHDSAVAENDPRNETTVPSDSLHFTKDDLYSCIYPTCADLQKIGKEKVVLERLPEKFFSKYQATDVPKSCVSSNIDQVSRTSQSLSPHHDKSDECSSLPSIHQNSSVKNNHITKPAVFDSPPSSTKYAIQTSSIPSPSHDDQPTPLSPSLKMKFKIKRINTRSKESHIVIVDKKFDLVAEKNIKVAPLRIRYSPIANVSCEKQQQQQENCNSRWDHSTMPLKSEHRRSSHRSSKLVHKRLHPILNTDSQNKTYRSPLLVDEPCQNVEHDTAVRKRKYYPFHRRKYSHSRSKTKEKGIASKPPKIFQLDCNEMEDPDENSQPLVESCEDLQPLVESCKDLQPLVESCKDLQPLVESRECLQPLDESQEKHQPLDESHKTHQPLDESLILRIPLPNKGKATSKKMSSYTSAMENDFKYSKHSKKLRLKLSRCKQKLPKLQLKLNCNLWTCGQTTEQHHLQNSDLNELENVHKSNEKPIKIILPKCSPKKKCDFNLKPVFLDGVDSDMNSTIGKLTQNSDLTKQKNLWEPCIVILTRLTHETLSKYNVRCPGKCNLCDQNSFHQPSNSNNRLSANLRNTNHANEQLNLAAGVSDSQYKWGYEDTEDFSEQPKTVPYTSHRTKRQSRKHLRNNDQNSGYKPVLLIPRSEQKKSESQLSTTSSTCQSTNNLLERLKAKVHDYARKQAVDGANDYPEKSYNQIQASTISNSCPSIHTSSKQLDDGLQASDYKHIRRIANGEQPKQGNQASVITSCHNLHEEPKNKTQVPHIEQVDESKRNHSGKLNRRQLSSISSTGHNMEGFPAQPLGSIHTSAGSTVEQEDGNVVVSDEQRKNDNYPYHVSDNDFCKQLKEEGEVLQTSVRKPMLEHTSNLELQVRNKVVSPIISIDSIDNIKTPPTDEAQISDVPFNNLVDRNILREPGNGNQMFTGSSCRQLGEPKLASCPIASESPIYLDKTSTMSSPLLSCHESVIGDRERTFVIKSSRAEDPDDHIDVMWQLAYLSPKEDLSRTVHSPPQSWSPNSGSVDSTDSWDLSTNKPVPNESPFSVDEDFVPSKKCIPVKTPKLPNFLFEEFTFSSDSFSPELRQMPQTTLQSHIPKECFTEPSQNPKSKLKSSEKYLSPGFESLDSHPSPKASVRSSILYHTLTSRKGSDVTRDNERNFNVPVLKDSPQVSTNLVVEDNKNLYFSTPPSTELSFYSTLEDDMDSLCNSPFELVGSMDKGSEADKNSTTIPSGDENTVKCATQDSKSPLTESTSRKAISPHESLANNNKFHIVTSPENSTKSTQPIMEALSDHMTKAPLSFTDWLNQHSANSECSHVTSDSPSQLFSSNEPVASNKFKTGSSLSVNQSSEESVLISQLKSQPQLPNFVYNDFSDMASCMLLPNMPPSLSGQDSTRSVPPPPPPSKYEEEQMPVLLPQPSQTSQHNSFTLSAYENTENCSSLGNQALLVASLPNDTENVNFGSLVSPSIINENTDSHSNDLLSKLVKSCDIDKEFETDFFLPEPMDQVMPSVSNVIIVNEKTKNLNVNANNLVINTDNHSKIEVPEKRTTTKSAFCIENLLKSPLKKQLNSDTIVKKEATHYPSSKLPSPVIFQDGRSAKKLKDDVLQTLSKQPISPKSSDTGDLINSSYSNFSGIQSFYGDETLYSLPPELDSIGSPSATTQSAFSTSQNLNNGPQGDPFQERDVPSTTSTYSANQPSTEFQALQPKIENKDFFLGNDIPPLRDKTRISPSTSSHIKTKGSGKLPKKSSNIFKPKINPPSRIEMEIAANQCIFPQEHHQLAFYGDPSDVDQKTTEPSRYKVRSSAICELTEFDGTFRSMKEDANHNHLKLPLSFASNSFCLADEIEKNPDYKTLFCNDKSIIQMPNILPPSRLKVSEWLVERDALQAGKTLKHLCKTTGGATNQSLSDRKTPVERDKKAISDDLLKLPQSPILVSKGFEKLPFSRVRESASISEPVVSTPVSGRNHQFARHQVSKGKGHSNDKTDTHRHFNGSDSFALSPTTSLTASLKRRKLIFDPEKGKGFNQDLRMKKMKEVFHRTLSPNNSLLSNLLNKSSSQIDGPLYENTGNFKFNLGSDICSQNQHENQHLTLMSVEIHINTRENLRPNPEHDSVSALFFCISFEGDADLEYLNGVIAIDGCPPSEDLQTVSLKKELLSTPNLSQDLIFCVESEEKVFEEFISLVQRFDPEFFIGYEIQTLSFGYLIQRASCLGIDLRTKISRLVPSEQHRVPFNNDKEVNHEDLELDPQFDLNVTGRILLNVWRLMRKEISLTSYTFENMYYHVLHKRVPLYSFETITAWYTNTKLLMRWKVLKHYLTRVEGSIRLLEKLNVIGRTSELARIFGIQFYEVLSRGSQFRVESMMLRTAKPLNYIPVSPTVQQRSRSRAPECVPLIFEPESRFYTDPVLILDFQSLYPSMIIAYNYCFSTCLGRIEHFGKTGPFEFGCTSLSISLDLLRKWEKDIHISPTGVAFVKASVKRGVLPIMLEEILNTRIMVKQSLKLCKSNKALSRILDSRQLGLKLIANVTYGYTSANFSGRMPCVEIADSIVGKGRETLERAIRVIEESIEWKAKVVYGDTDSVFVLLPGRSKEQAFKIGQDIADVVTALNPKPVKLKFEKVYFPCVLQTKKRYVGYMYETLEQKEPVFDAKGIEIVRRDSCPAVGKVLEKSIKLLFDTRDISCVKKYVLKQFEKFSSGRVSVADCIFAKEYRGRSGYRPAACVPALEIAKKRALSDPKAEPLPGERVPYVVVYGFPGLPIIQLIKEPLEFLNDWTFRINAKYYITHVITPPLERIFSLIGVSIRKWYVNISYAQLPSLPMAPVTSKRKGTLSQYFKTLCCPACEKTTNSGVCDSCRSESQKTAIILNDKIRLWERTYHHLAQICSGCSTSHCFEDCISLDCPVFFRLNQTRRDLSQIPYLRNILLNELF